MMEEEFTIYEPSVASVRTQLASLFAKIRRATKLKV